MATEIIISDANAHEFIQPTVDGLPRSTGLIPRDYDKYPVGFYGFAKPFDLPLIPKSEWGDRLEILKKNKSRLSDLRMRANNGKPIPSTDQNGRGYCWCHSGVSCNLILRALEGQPYAPLSAYMIGCLVKNYRDEGGWGTQGIEFQVEHGVPTDKYWPQQGTKKEYDTPEMRANAKLHRIEEWMDMEPRNVDQLVTCLLSLIPVVTDFNWWRHSVMGMDLESVNPLRIRIWNSWGDGWSDHGMGILEGSKAIPDGMVAPRVIRASDEH